MGYLPSAFQPTLTNKVTILVDDITKMQVDAIVNPTNPNLTTGGSGTASAAILDAAGYALVQDLQQRPAVAFGDAITTPSYRLRTCHYIIHTPVPHFTQGEEKLRQCYWNALTQLVGQCKESIAFPCMGTGVQRFDNEVAARVAMSTVKDFLGSSSNRGHEIKRIIFCVYSVTDKEIYQRLLPNYFPGCS